MPNLHATFSYPGLTNIRQAFVRFPSGKTPGRIRIVSESQDDTPDPVGTFGLSEQDLVLAGGNVTITMPDCALVQSLPQTDGSLVTILEDFRWLWRFGNIDGVYNERTGDEIDHEMTPQELATLLLDAIGEINYDVSDLPNDARPYVSWLQSNPADELERLCRDLGCKIDIDSMGRTRISVVGSGVGVPDLPYRERFVSSSSVAQLPGTLQVFGGPVQFQCRFALEAVGPEVGGGWKPVEDLSWKPAEGWGVNVFGDFSKSLGAGTITLEGQELERSEAARKYIYRHYGVASLVGGSGPNNWNPPGFDSETATDLTGLVDLLPLKNYRNETYLDPTGVSRRYNALLAGEFYSFERFKKGNDPDGTTWKSGWSLDGDLGIVTLSDLAIREDVGAFGPAVLFLTCVCEADSIGLNTKVYYAKFLTNTDPNSQAGAEVSSHPEILLKYTAVYDGNGALLPTVDNKDDVDEESDFYLAAMAEEYKTQPSGVAYFSGIHQVGLAGDIHEITWSAGGQPSQTVVGYNANVSPHTPSYREAKRSGKVEEDPWIRRHEFSDAGVWLA